MNTRFKNIAILLLAILIFTLIFIIITKPRQTTVQASIGASTFETTGNDQVVVRMQNGNLNTVHAEKFLAPTGTIVLWATDKAPTGWIFCRGQSIGEAIENNRYKLLREALGNATNAPDLQGYTVSGTDSTNFNTIVGAESVKLDLSNVSQHAHAIPYLGARADGKIKPVPWNATIPMDGTKCREFDDDKLLIGDSVLRNAFTVGTADGWTPISEVTLPTTTGITGRTPGRN